MRPILGLLDGLEEEYIATRGTPLNPGQVFHLVRAIATHGRRATALYDTAHAIAFVLLAVDGGDPNGT
jgi:hypothetical protein